VPTACRLSSVLLPLVLGLAACTATPPANPFAGNTGNLWNPMPFMSYQAQALSAQIANQSQPPTQYAQDPIRYDGSYKGTATLISATGVCPNGRTGILQIGDNTLTYSYTPQLVFQVPVGANGRLHGVAGDAVLDGVISDNELRMVVKTPNCTTVYDNAFVYNHS
jgi:hypothetical protein